MLHFARILPYPSTIINESLCGVHKQKNKKKSRTKKFAYRRFSNVAHHASQHGRFSFNNGDICWGVGINRWFGGRLGGRRPKRIKMFLKYRRRGLIWRKVGTMTDVLFYRFGHCKKNVMANELSGSWINLLERVVSLSLKGLSCAFSLETFSVFLTVSAIKKVSQFRWFSQQFTKRQSTLNYLRNFETSGIDIFEL